MKFEISAVTAGFFALAFAAPDLAHAQNIYLSWPGVPGSAVVAALPGLNGTIPLKTYKQGFNGPNVTTVGQQFKIDCGTVIITKPTDGSSTSFLTKTMTAVTAIPKLTFTFTNPGSVAGTLFVPVQIVLLNAYVTGVSQTVDASVATAPLLIDSISLLATTIEATYIPLLANGTAGTAQKFGWNCAMNTSVTF
jgi:type VI protein secretion system component Hcp